jgi:glycosyltransferase involved in cell wall biosynthesis
MFLTIFTPAYNRAYTLTRLYNSLVAQTNSAFEWLIVDDGSTDDTEALVQKIITENKITIRYFRQINGGKHRAINCGVTLAQGDLFFIVDSDDYIAENAVERINYHYNNIKNDKNFAGVCGCKAYFSGDKVGGQVTYQILDCSSFAFRYKYKIKGDMAEVFRTDVMLQFSFPEIDGEKFISESAVWNKIAERYKLRYFNENIYFCEYLSDGLSNQSVRLRKNNPKGATLLYSGLSQMPIPLIQKIKANINYWRFARYLQGVSFCEKWEKVNPFISLFGLPMSWIFLLKDK